MYIWFILFLCQANAHMHPVKLWFKVQATGILNSYIGFYQYHQMWIVKIKYDRHVQGLPTYTILSKHEPWKHLSRSCLLPITPNKGRSFKSPNLPGSFNRLHNRNMKIPDML